MQQKKYRLVLSDIHTILTDIFNTNEQQHLIVCNHVLNIHTLYYTNIHNTHITILAKQYLIVSTLKVKSEQIIKLFTKNKAPSTVTILKTKFNILFLKYSTVTLLHHPKWLILTYKVHSEIQYVHSVLSVVYCLVFCITVHCLTLVNPL